MNILRLLFLFSSIFITAQDGFEILHHKKRISIPFTQINNLIFINLNVNGVNLTFLLDTGISETLLFSLENKEIAFNNVEKVKFSGLGGSDFIEGIKSTNNKVSLDKHLIDSHHDLYIILDENFNFSSHVGIPVNGIIGGHFFKNHLIKIDFRHHLITVYNEEFSPEKKFKKYEKIPLSIESDKPYITAEIQESKAFFPAKMLIDLGNSDALWIFPNKIPHFNHNQPHIDDFLGRGFNGDIYGRRSRIHALKIGTSLFEKPIVSIPNQESIQNLLLNKERIGSIGSDILKRFVLALDYKKGVLYLKKTPAIQHPFKFNMSGIDLKHDGMKWEKDLVKVALPKSSENQNEKGNTLIFTPSEFQYKFVLKPEYSVAGVREGSPGFLSGIQKGDKLLEINGKKVSDMDLQQINEILMSEENKTLKIKLLRNDSLLHKELLLKDPIPYRDDRSLSDEAFGL